MSDTKAWVMPVTQIGMLQMTTKMTTRMVNLITIMIMIITVTFILKVVIIMTVYITVDIYHIGAAKQPKYIYSFPGENLMLNVNSFAYALGCVVPL